MKPVHRITNRQLLLSIAPDFLQWLIETKFLHCRFTFLANALQSYFLNRILVNDQICKDIVSQFPNANKSNESEFYNDINFVHAYVIMWFLERYYRTQIIALYLLQNGCLPVRDLESDILDLGSGPGLAMLAVSDMCSFLKKYGVETGINNLADSTFNFSYIENSKEFYLFQRNFFNYLSEYNPSSRQQIQGCYSAPHFTRVFDNFVGLNLQHEKQKIQADQVETYLEENEEMSPCMARFFVDHLDTNWKNELRYNLIMSSNFINRDKDVDFFAREIRSSCRALRNGGLLCVTAREGNRLTKIQARLIEKLERPLLMRPRGVLHHQDLVNLLNQFDVSHIISDFSKSILNRLNEHSDISSGEKHVTRMRKGTIVPFGLIIFRKQILGKQWS